MDSLGLKVLLVDDDKVGRFMLASELGKQFRRIDQAESAEQMLAMLSEQRYDVVVLDINLPGIDGCSAAVQIRDQSDVGIIIISVIHDLRTRLLALRSGADDFILKPVNMDELALKVAALGIRVQRGRGREYRKHEDHLCDAIDVDHKRRLISNQIGRSAPLTGGESALLLALQRNAGEVCSRDDLLSAICEAEMPDSTLRTVDTLVSRIRAKIRTLEGCANCIHTQRSAGYLIDRRGSNCSEE